MSNILPFRQGGSGPATPTGGDGGMEARIAKLESDVGHIQTDVADIKADLRKIPDKIDVVRDKIDKVKDSIASAKIWALILYIALAATLLGVIARGFKWL